MNSLLVAGVSVFLLVLGYVFYSRKVKQWLGVDDAEPVPSVEMNDGVDYVPAKHWTILFGHHFASIAGAAPMIVLVPGQSNLTGLFSIVGIGRIRPPEKSISYRSTHYLMIN